MEVAHRVLGDGEPLLLVAGTAFSGSTWPPTFLQLLARSRSVITFDHRGTGATPATENVYSTRGFAADALELLDRLHLRSVDVLGHSMGGRVAQWMALDRPESVHRLVLAASGPGHFRSDEPAVTGVPLRQALGLAEKGYERYTNDHLRSTFFTPEAEASEAADWLVMAYWESAPSLEGYLKHVIARQQHDTVRLLAKIAQPALVLVGERDTHAGGTGSHVDQSRYLAGHLPNATYRELPSLSHGFFWQDPDSSADAVLGWLAQTAGSGSPPGSRRPNSGAR